MIGSLAVHQFWKDYDPKKEIPRCQQTNSLRVAPSMYQKSFSTFTCNSNQWSWNLSIYYTSKRFLPFWSSLHDWLLYWLLLLLVVLSSVLLCCVYVSWCLGTVLINLYAALIMSKHGEHICWSIGRFQAQLWMAQLISFQQPRAAPRKCDARQLRPCLGWWVMTLSRVNQRSIFLASWYDFDSSNIKI